MFACLLILIAGCQFTPTKAPPNTLRIGFAQDPTTLDPRKSSDYASSTLICLLFEGLTRCKTGSEVELAIAEKVDIATDGKTYTFTLRKTFWTDGQAVTASDFEESWKTILTPGFPAPCAYLLYPIKNGEAYAKGLCSREDVGIRSLNASTLQVELESATPYFLSLTAFPLYLPSHCGSQNKGDPLICNGPFVIETMKPGSEIILKKNSAFWNPPQIHLDKIQIHIVPSEFTALNLFEKGELDFIGGPLAPIGIESLPDRNLHFLPMAASTFCTMNTEIFPFSNKTLRKAFALSVKNHPMIAQEVEMLGQIRALHILPPTLSLSQKVPTNEEALPLLHQALQELQITLQDLSSLTLYYKAGPMEKKIAQTLQRVWEETLGVHVQIEQIDPKSLAQKLYAKNYQLSLTSWIAQFHDPINILERFREEKNPKNYSGWSSREYKELLSLASSTQNPRERILHLEMAENLLEEQTLLIPLYHWRSPMLIHPRIHGLKTTHSGGLLIEQSSIGPESFAPHR